MQTGDLSFILKNRTLSSLHCTSSGAIPDSNWKFGLPTNEPNDTDVELVIRTTPDIIPKINFEYTNTPIFPKMGTLFMINF